MDKDNKLTKSETKFQEDMAKVTWVLENFEELTIEDQLITLSAVTEMKNLILPIYRRYHEGTLYEKAGIFSQLASMFGQDTDDE